MATANNGKAWGIDNEYGALKDVLLGRPDHYRWTDAGALTQRTFDNAERLGYRFDLQLAQKQHAEMVRCYEEGGRHLPLHPARRASPPQFFRTRFKRHDAVRSDHLPYAVEDPAAPTM